MKKANLPERSEAVEMIIHLTSPFQTMAWMMLEAGLKISELQALRVRDVQIDRGRLLSGGRTHELSAGLMESLSVYMGTILRPAYEQLKRRAGDGFFPAQRLFPAWILDGYEDMSSDAAMPADEFVAALQFAAQKSGYTGMVNSNTLRLVAAREWLQQGMSVTALHGRLGHRDLMTTMLLAQSLQHGGLTFADAA